MPQATQVRPRRLDPGPALADATQDVGASTGCGGVGTADDRELAPAVEPRVDPLDLSEVNDLDRADGVVEQRLVDAVGHGEAEQALLPLGVRRDCQAAPGRDDLRGVDEPLVQGLVQVAVVGAEHPEFNEHVLDLLRRGALFPDGEEMPFGRAELQAGQHHERRVAGGLSHPVAPAGSVVVGDGDRVQPGGDRRVDDLTGLTRAVSLRVDIA